MKGQLREVCRLSHLAYIFVISIKIHANTCKHIPWTIWRFCHDDFNGCFVSMCLKCQYEAKNYMFKESKVLNWWNIAIKLALEETNRDGQKLKEKVAKLENTMAMEWYMFGNVHS